MAYDTDLYWQASNLNTRFCWGYVRSFPCSLISNDNNWWLNKGCYCQWISRKLKYFLHEHFLRASRKISKKTELGFSQSMVRGEKLSGSGYKLKQGRFLSVVRNMLLLLVQSSTGTGFLEVFLCLSLGVFQDESRENLEWPALTLCQALCWSGSCRNTVIFSSFGIQLCRWVAICSTASSYLRKQLCLNVSTLSLKWIISMDSFGSKCLK